MSAKIEVYFFIKVILVWKEILDIAIVFKLLKHYKLTSHSFAFYNITNVYFIKRSIISSGCSLYVERQHIPYKNLLLIRASNYFMRKIKCMNLLLYVFYVNRTLFDMLEMLAPFETKVLLGAKYATSRLISLLGCAISYICLLGPKV